jgi:predicted dehydrogenase
VLVDKPIAATIQDARALAAARDRADRTVSVGYQWSYSVAIRSLKHDLLAGVYGRPRRLTTLCAWPRDEAYYRRNSWAGRLRDPDSGAWVLDSPANNAMAHFLHNALFLLGPSADESATPVQVQGELYRAYDIESADTAACRIELTGGGEVVFLASHVTDSAVAPRFRIACDRGVITFGEPQPRIVGTTAAGVNHDYGDPDATPQFEKLSVAIALAGGVAREFCRVEAASAQTLCVNALHDSVPRIGTFNPAPARSGEGARARLFVPGLDEALARCYERGVLPAEAGYPWACRGRSVDVTRYAGFPDGLPSAGPPGEQGPE